MLSYAFPSLFPGLLTCVHARRGKSGKGAPSACRLNKEGANNTPGGVCTFQKSRDKLLTMFVLYLLFGSGLAARFRVASSIFPRPGGPVLALYPSIRHCGFRLGLAAARVKRSRATARRARHMYAFSPLRFLFVAC